MENREILPKDDIENLIYALIYLKNGTLPWLKYKNEKDRDFSEKILKIHNDLSINELLYGFPMEVKFLFKQVKNLKPQDIPDYDIYIELLESALTELKTNYSINDSKYDWEIKLQKIYDYILNLKINLEKLTEVFYLFRGYSSDVMKFLNVLKKSDKILFLK